MKRIFLAIVLSLIFLSSCDLEYQPISLTVNLNGEDKILSEGESLSISYSLEGSGSLEAYIEFLLKDNDNYITVLKRSLQPTRGETQDLFLPDLTLIDGIYLVRSYVYAILDGKKNLVQSTVRDQGFVVDTTAPEPPRILHDVTSRNDRWTGTYFDRKTILTTTYIPVNPEITQIRWYVLDVPTTTESDRFGFIFPLNFVTGDLPDLEFYSEDDAGNQSSPYTYDLISDPDSPVTSLPFIDRITNNADTTVSDISSTDISSVYTLRFYTGNDFPVPGEFIQAEHSFEGFLRLEDSELIWNDSLKCYETNIDSSWFQAAIPNSGNIEFFLYYPDNKTHTTPAILGVTP
jgi:hypothetical protein